MILRKILKVFGRVLLGLLGLLIILLVLLQFSFIQTYITHKASDYLSKELKTNISIGEVDISLLLHLQLKDVKIEDLHHNNLLKASLIEVRISSINFPKHVFNVPKIAISDLDFKLRYYKGENNLNLQFLIDYFSDTSQTESKPWIFKINKIKLVNSHFTYDIDDDNFIENGMDYSHLDVRNINLDLKDFKSSGDTLFAKIESLTAKEKCGFTLLDFKSDLKISSAGLFLPNLHLKTPGSNLNLNLHFDYGQWGDWLDYINKMKMVLKIKPSVLAFNEISAFSSSLEGMNDTIKLQGEFKGTVASFRVKDLKIEYSENTLFQGSIKMDGLPDFDKTFMMVKIDKCISNKDEIESIFLPGQQHIKLPGTLTDIGDIKLNGRFTGYYYDFVSNATFITGFGQLQTDISLQPLSGSRKLAYNGNLKADNFQLGRFLKLDDLMGVVSLNADIKGYGLDDSTNANFNINISKFELDNNNYSDVSVKGKIGNKKIAAFLHSRKEEFSVDLDAEYDYRNALPNYKIIGNIENAALSRFLRTKMDTLGDISTKVNISMKGNNLDNLEGSIILDSIIYNYRNKRYVGGKIDLLSQLSVNERNLYLQSKYFDLKLSGQYRFSDFESDFQTMLYSILPSVFPDLNSKIAHGSNYKDLKSSDFDLNINVKNSDDLFEILFPQIKLSKGTILQAHFGKAQDSLNFVLESHEIIAYGIAFKELHLDGVKSENLLVSTFKAGSMNISDSLSFDSLLLNMNISGDTIFYASRWGQAGTRINRGLLNGNFVFFSKNEIHSNINVGEVIFNDSLWIVNQENEMVYKDHYLSIQNFVLSSGENRISANGLLSDDANDKLIFDFQNFNLEVINPFVKDYIPTLGGIINGQFELSNIWESTNFYSNINIIDFKFNNQFLGIADIQSRWSIANQAVIIDMGLDSPINKTYLKTLDIHGFYYPYNNENNFDLTMNLNQLSLKPIGYLLTSFSSSCEGKAMGELKLLGTPSHPILRGEILTDVKALKIDYTNTTYSFKDYIRFDDGLISLSNVKCFDQNYTSGSGNQALLDLKIKHKAFSDFNLDLKVTPSEALVLNTTYLDNSIYYGKAVTSGKLSISGPFDDLKMSIDVESKKGTNLAISLEDNLEVEKFDFVTFKKPQAIIDSLAQIILKTEDPFYLDLNLNAKLNQDATIQLVMNREINDIITAKGYGDIRMRINEEGDIKIFGKYNITKGDYNFVFNNVKVKQFQIKEGSYVSWNGNIEDAKIDIVAQYKLYAKLSDLLETIDSNDVYKRQTKVICQINIKGDLYNPDEPVFSIILPDATNDTKDLVNRLLNTTDGNSGNNYFMNLNFMSLLITGRFQPPTGQNFDLNPTAASTNNATEILANQLGSIMSKLIKDVDIDLNYNPGDENTTQEIAAAFSYSMLNNRLIIDGKIGGGGELRSSQSSRIVGDVDIAYKITEDGRFLVKFYNRTNYDDPTRKAPYTQGAGIAYRKDFDSFGELFRRKKKKDNSLK